MPCLPCGHAHDLPCLPCDHVHDVAPQVLPHFQLLLAGWEPLAEPLRGHKELKQWRPLLESSGAREAVMQVHEGGSG